MMNEIKKMPKDVLGALVFVAVLVILGMIWLPWFVIPFVVLVVGIVSVMRIAHWFKYER
jgi:hypothetical protein